jgi:hypothetical protein
MLLQQIEKFVETLFPSQKIEDAQRKVAGEVSKEDEEAKRRQQESWDDMKVMFAIMGAMVLGISVILVCGLSTPRVQLYTKLQNSFSLPGCWVPDLIWQLKSSGRATLGHPTKSSTRNYSFDQRSFTLLAMYYLSTLCIAFFKRWCFTDIYLQDPVMLINDEPQLLLVFIDFGSSGGNLARMSNCDSALSWLQLCRRSAYIDDIIISRGRTRCMSILRKRDSGRHPLKNLNMHA